MKTQNDQEVRVVALSNLHAMCARTSGVMCHQFKVTSVSRSRVHVEYSNENEYATAEPMTAVFPCYPGAWDSSENPNVILDVLRKDARTRRRIIRERLTLEEAQAHCSDPETSSSTCTGKVGKARTRRVGAWFDGYEDR